MDDFTDIVSNDFIDLDRIEERLKQLSEDSNLLNQDLNAFYRSNKREVELGLKKATDFHEKLSCLNDNFEKCFGKLTSQEGDFISADDLDEIFNEYDVKFDAVDKALHCLNQFKVTATNLAQVEEALQRNNVKLAFDKFSKCSSTLIRDDLYFKDIAFYNHLHSKIPNIKKKLSNSLIESFDSLYQLSPNNATKCVLKQFKASHTHILNSLLNFDLLHSNLLKLSKFLLHDIFLTLFNDPNLFVKCQTKDFDIKIQFQKNKKACEFNQALLRQRIQNLILIIENLLQSFLKSEVSISSTALHICCNQISEKFLEHLLQFFEKCLPTNSKEYVIFVNEVNTEIEELQNCLVKNGLINKHHNYLTRFCENIGEHYFNKKATSYFIQCRVILSRSLLEGVPAVVEDTNPDVLTFEQNYLGQRNSTEVTSKLPLSNLNDNLFLFPSCSISSSMKDYIELCRSLLSDSQDMAEINQRIASQLRCSLQSLVLMYINLIGVFHQREIEQSSVVAALHHNNLLYLSHQLINLGIEYSSHCSESLPLNFGFVDLIPFLRQHALKTLKAFMLQQNSELQIMLSDLQENLNSISNNFELSERILLQISMFIGSLVKGLFPVMTRKLFINCICTFIDKSVSSVISFVLEKEDITSKDCESFVHLLKNFIQTAPSRIFDSTGDAKKDFINFLVLYVSNWCRLKELIIVLNSDLESIEDRWADGKGPLAEYFNSNEVRSLIRALFQNTEKRARVISKIIK